MLQTKRIESIDVLRAVVLLGILIVHCVGGFGIIRDPQPYTLFDLRITQFNALFLNNKCNTAFNTLFGLSFWFIQSKHGAHVDRFIWRCALLVCIGLFNKIFYWYDVLMLYGLTGIALTAFYKLPVRALLASAATLYLISILIIPLFELHRYITTDNIQLFLPPGSTFTDVISRPLKDGIEAYLYLVSDGGCIKVFACQIAGYAIGKSGILSKLDKIITPKLLIVLWLLSMATFCFRYKVHTDIAFVENIKMVDNMAGFAAYCATVLYMYYHINCKRLYSWLASYGRMGLTNYSLQAIISVFIMSSSGADLSEAPTWCIIVYLIIFYICQVIFSHIWLKYMYYGPLEWLWRSGTQLSPAPLRRKPQ